MVSQKKEIQSETKLTETDVEDEDEDEFAALFGKIGNANSVLSPSNIGDGDYKIVGKGIADVDYKDGAGLQRIPYFEFSDAEDCIIQAKITSRLKLALLDSGMDFLNEPFHFESRGKGFNVHVAISRPEHDFT